MPAVRRLFGGLDVTRDVTLISSVPEFELTRLQQFYVQRLPKIINPGYVAEMVYTGGDVTAQRARQMGLVTEVYPDRTTLQRRFR